MSMSNDSGQLTTIITQLWEAKQRSLLESVAVYPRLSYTKILILFHNHTPPVIKINLEKLFATKYNCETFMAGDIGAVMSVIVHEPMPQHLEPMFKMGQSINVNMWYFMD